MNMTMNKVKQHTNAYIFLEGRPLDAGSDAITSAQHLEVRHELSIWLSQGFTGLLVISGASTHKCFSDDELNNPFLCRPLQYNACGYVAILHQKGVRAGTRDKASARIYGHLPSFVRSGHTQSSTLHGLNYGRIAVVCGFTCLPLCSISSPFFPSFFQLHHLVTQNFHCFLYSLTYSYLHFFLGLFLFPIIFLFPSIFIPICCIYQHFELFDCFSSLVRIKIYVDLLLKRKLVILARIFSFFPPSSFLASTPASPVQLLALPFVISFFCAVFDFFKETLVSSTNSVDDLTLQVIGLKGLFIHRLDVAGDQLLLYQTLWPGC